MTLPSNLPEAEARAEASARKGVQHHADMHPLTRARINVLAELGRDMAALIEAHKLLLSGDVNPPYIQRKHDIYKQTLNRLIEAAQAEGVDSEVADRLEAVTQQLTAANIEIGRLREDREDAKRRLQELVDGGAKLTRDQRREYDAMKRHFDNGQDGGPFSRHRDSMG